LAADDPTIAIASGRPLSIRSAGADPNRIDSGEACSATGDSNCLYSEASDSATSASLRTPRRKAHSRRIDLRSKLSIVVLTHNRVEHVVRTVQRLTRLPEICDVIVVDNGSSDGTCEALHVRFPHVILVRLSSNRGASGRNAGVERAHTPYVAFCDDDTWWAPGALSRAVELLDAHATIGLLCAKVLVEPGAREDPTCLRMANSPLQRQGLPGPSLLGFLAGGCVVRRCAFLAVGGYEPAFFLGGEEDLLALDLAASGWSLVYASQLLAYHQPAARTDSARRRSLIARNAVWTAWLRRPLPIALRITVRALRDAAARRQLLQRAIEIGAGAPWLLRNRRPLPAHVESMRRMLDQCG